MCHILTGMSSGIGVGNIFFAFKGFTSIWAGMHVYLKKKRKLELHKLKCQCAKVMRLFLICSNNESLNNIILTFPLFTS